MLFLVKKKYLIASVDCFLVLLEKKEADNNPHNAVLPLSSSGHAVNVRIKNTET